MTIAQLLAGVGLCTNKLEVKAQGQEPIMACSTWQESGAGVSVYLHYVCACLQCQHACLPALQRSVCLPLPACLHRCLLVEAKPASC